MFNIFKKKSVLTFHLDKDIDNAWHYKPNIAIKFMPRWFKTIKDQYFLENDNQIRLPTSTVKKCPSVVKFLSYKGFILPLWSDLILRVSDNNVSYQFADKHSQIHFHDKDQHGNFLPNHIHCKIISPWYGISNTLINYLYMDPFMFLEEKTMLVYPNGITNFYYQHNINIPFFIPLAEKNQSYEIFLEAGDPILFCLQLNDLQVNYDYQLVYDKKTFSIQNKFFLNKFVNIYAEFKKIKHEKL